MTLEYIISAGHPFCMGVMSQTNGIHIAMPFPESEGKECGMLLYKASHELARIVFPECYKMGEVYVLFINMQMEADYTYLFFCGEDGKRTDRGLHLRRIHSTGKMICRCGYLMKILFFIRCMYVVLQSTQARRSVHAVLLQDLQKKSLIYNSLVLQP